MEPKIPSAADHPAGVPTMPGQVHRGAERESAAMAHAGIHADPHPGGGPQFEPGNGQFVGQWEREDPLEAPPPRPGFTQRWIYIGHGSAGDAYARSCWSQAVDREGFTPRRMETLTHQTPFPFEGQQLNPHQQQATNGYIIRQGMILMERDERITQQRDMHFRKKTYDRTAMLEVNLQNETKSYGGPGVSRDVDIQTRSGNSASPVHYPTSRGRVPPSG